MQAEKRFNYFCLRIINHFLQLRHGKNKKLKEVYNV